MAQNFGELDGPNQQILSPLPLTRHVMRPSEIGIETLNLAVVGAVDRLMPNNSEPSNPRLRIAATAALIELTSRVVGSYIPQPEAEQDMFNGRLNPKETYNTSSYLLKEDYRIDPPINARIFQFNGEKLRDLRHVDRLRWTLTTLERFLAFTRIKRWMLGSPIDDHLIDYDSRTTHFLAQLDQGRIGSVRATEFNREWLTKAIQAGGATDTLFFGDLNTNLNPELGNTTTTVEQLMDTVDKTGTRHSASTKFNELLETGSYTNAIDGSKGDQLVVVERLHTPAKSWGVAYDENVEPGSPNYQESVRKYDLKAAGSIVSMLIFEMAANYLETGQTLWLLQTDKSFISGLKEWFGEDSLLKCASVTQERYKKGYSELEPDECITYLLDIEEALKFVLNTYHDHARKQFGIDMIARIKLNNHEKGSKFIDALLPIKE